MRNLLIMSAITLAVSLSLAVHPAIAQQGISVQIAPPAVQVETAPPPSTPNGAVYMPGHYVWNAASHSYTWVAGSWQVPPASSISGAVWTPGAYVWSPSAHTYVWQSGSWQTPPHSGMVWVPAHTIRLEHGGYKYYDGHWATPHQVHEEKEAEEDLER